MPIESRFDGILDKPKKPKKLPQRRVRKGGDVTRSWTDYSGRRMWETQITFEGASRTYRFRSGRPGRVEIVNRGPYVMTVTLSGESAVAAVEEVLAINIEALASKTLTLKRAASGPDIPLTPQSVVIREEERGQTTTTTTSRDDDAVTPTLLNRVSGLFRHDDDEEDAGPATMGDV